MTVEWLDHPADAGFRIQHATLAGAFAEAAHALFSLMIDLSSVRPQVVHHVDLSAETVEELLVVWLTELLSQKDIDGLVFSQFQVDVWGEEATRFRCVGRAWGEPIDRAVHSVRTEVKGISYLGLSARPCKKGWRLQLIVDV